MKRAITLKPQKGTSAKAVDRDNPPWSEEMLGPPGSFPTKRRNKMVTFILNNIDERPHKEIYDLDDKLKGLPYLITTRSKPVTRSILTLRKSSQVIAP